MGKSVYNVSRLPLKIPWSKANFHYGYIYGIEGLSFADVSSGPSRWINKAYYKCWFNIEENDSKPVSQSHKTWSIVNTDAVHEYNLHHQLYTLEITEGSHFIFNSDLRITQSLKITDGSLTICGEPLYVKDIEIGKNGRLVIQGDSTILVSGDWTNNNNFFPRSESVVFNGKVPQKISGVTQFYSLEIETDSIVESSTISAHVLSIHSGVFTPRKRFNRYPCVHSRQRGALPCLAGICFCSGIRRWQNHRL